MRRTRCKSTPESPMSSQARALRTRRDLPYLRPGVRSRSWREERREGSLHPSFTESEERQLMLRLEGLARMEGLREDSAAIRISSSTQALIDSKAAENGVLKRDGSVSLSADWDVGEDRKILFGSDAYMHRDGAGNLTFADAVVGERTLKNIGCPAYIFIKATAQPEGDLHLSNAATWAVSKALIKAVRVVTSSTDWDLYLLQNDSGHSANNGNIPEIQIMGAGNGNANILLNLPYEDEDGSHEVHLYYSDNSGTNTADIYIIGHEMV